jgi:hypothetical protein
MAKLFGELLIYFARVIVFDLVSGVVFKFFAWLDMQIPGRWPRIVVGGLLGIAAYFAIPILLGLLSL